MNENRPKHLALHHISFPLSAIVSILHRISGALLFLSLPLLLWTLQYSLRSIETFTMLAWMLQHPISKLFLLVMLWALLHHFCAGIRYLAIDLDYGVRLAQARASSKWVLVVSLTLTILIGTRLW
jgi:succinate dehydrogenase / fumarate reductase cytochrome b subunit